MWKWPHALDDLQVPDWAGFFDGAAYRAFIVVVADDLQRRGELLAIDEGIARLAMEGGQEHRFGLQNLAQLCHHAERDEWPDVIRRHFDGVIRSTAGADLDGLSHDFSRARGLLKVRLYPQDAVTGTHGGLIFREVADGLVSVLTYDLPDAVATVPRDDPERWPMTLSEAFSLGLRHALADPVQTEEILLEDGGGFLAMVGDSFFVTSRLLAMERVLDPVPAFGALAAVPNRHTLLVSPIVDATAMEAMQAMLLVTTRRYAEGPGSLSPHLYWWRPSGLQALPATLEDGELRVSPPDEFVQQCLQQLPAPRAGWGPN